ncbi:hypothetical protein K435DRAFT_810737 [Dendrothele bispora CBS 962.96]|uniref:Uncharacterized protein n=1 Tax=Dendrothele bispora (strain CBS 962.96) TaxID=1314807 RepID=A0A4S8KUK4_DENBC|nr:hypothetical protein K435DRAFT_810737 [Dendrothele bispora CBS 962.96]
MAPSRIFPVNPTTTFVLNIFVPATELLTTLVTCRGVIIGSIANYVASNSVPPAPAGLDIAVEHDGFGLISTFFQDQGYERSEDTVIEPWRSTAHSVTHFRPQSRRRIGPSSTSDYVRVVRLKSVPYALYMHILKSPTTAEMTFLTPLSWVCLYPDLWKERVSWFRWSDIVNQNTSDSETRLRKNGFLLRSSNTGHPTPCIDCPANNRLLTGGEGVRVVVHCLSRNRSDTYGQHASHNFASVPVKWRFSVHCFNPLCPRYIPFPVRQPDLFFAPSSDEVIESVTDDMCAYKTAWIFWCGLRYVLAALMRPDSPPTLVPFPVEPSTTTFHGVDSAMAEIWFPRPSSDVWTMKEHRMSKTDDEESPAVSYTLYIQSYDREEFEEAGRTHASAMLLIKHTSQGLLSFTINELGGLKRFVYEWLDPTLEESSDIYAGHSDYYADPDDC